jgi:triacylglycerol lipase
MGFDAKVTAHSFNNALALAQASGLAYADDPAAITAGLTQAFGSAPNNLQILAIPEHDTSVFVADFADSIIVSFRGTRDLANWLTNVQIQLMPFRGGGMVHRGFQDALDDVLADLSKILDGLSGQGRTLWLTGHSLGGALAMLAAAYLRFPADRNNTLPRPIAGIYTFGQPRVGTHAFCDACAANFGRYYFRYVNRQDIVTRVPPRELAYWHIDNIEYITETGTIESDPAWWQIFLDRVQVGMNAVRRLQLERTVTALISDHAINLYIDLISAFNRSEAPAKPQIPFNV